MLHYVFTLDIETRMYVFEYSGTESECYDYIESNYPDQYISNSATPNIKLVRDL